MEKSFGSDNKDLGYDVKAMEYCDLKEKGIFDPTKVIISSIVNAMSVAGAILTTTSLMVDTIKSNVEATR